MITTQARVLARLRAVYPHAITKAMCDPISKRSFEGAVRALRLAGHPIASNGEGYWFATDPRALRDTADAMLRRMAHQAQTRDALIETAQRMELAGMGAERPTIWEGIEA